MYRLNTTYTDTSAEMYRLNTTTYTDTGAEMYRLNTTTYAEMYSLSPLPPSGVTPGFHTKCYRQGCTDSI